MPLRYPAPYLPPLPHIAAPPTRGAQQGGGGGGGDITKKIIEAIGRGQQSQVSSAIDQARGAQLSDIIPDDYAGMDLANQPTVGDLANAVPDVLPDDYAGTDAQVADAINSAQLADTIGGFNWAAGV
jgi:hypothetical protein